MVGLIYIGGVWRFKCYNNSCSDTISMKVGLGHIKMKNTTLELIKIN